MNLSALIEDQYRNPGDEFTYMVRTASSVFRVINAHAFKIAMVRWPNIVVKEVSADLHPGQVELLCELLCGNASTIGNEYDVDAAARWPGSGKVFDGDFLRTIQDHLRPLQCCTLYEVSYDINDGDFMRVVVIPKEGIIVGSTLDDLLHQQCGAPRSPFENKVLYPDDGEIYTECGGDGTNPLIQRF